MFLLLFQYGQWGFSEDPGGAAKTETLEAVPEGEKEKKWWEKAIEFFTGSDPLEEMRALNEELKQLIENDRRLMEEIEKLKNDIDELKKARQNSVKD